MVSGDIGHAPHQVAAAPPAFNPGQFTQPPPNFVAPQQQQQQAAAAQAAAAALYGGGQRPGGMPPPQRQSESLPLFIPINVCTVV